MRLVGTLAIALAAGACDVVWSVDRVPDVTSGGRYFAPGDYDGDGKPNATDPCPYLKSPAGDSDRDGDGVGDECDPAPDKSGDCFVLFDGFTDVIDPAWVGDGVSGGDHYPWTICTDSGSPTYCSPRPPSTSWLYFTGNVRPTLLRAYIQVWTVSDVNASVVGVSTDMATAAGGNDVSGRFCEASRPDVVALTTHIGIADRVGGVLVNGTDKSSGVPYDNSHPYVFEWAPAGGACKLLTSSSNDSITPTSPAAAGGAGIGVRNMHVDINVLWFAGLGSC